jgi:hypothetical protein
MVRNFQKKNPFSISIMPPQSIFFSQNHNRKFLFENLTSNQQKTQIWHNIPKHKIPTKDWKKKYTTWSPNVNMLHNYLLT